ncbi:Hypothetical predicted protein [Olea europaea subsp. europaea]|uniref:Uncharacterized protein n=1 Tax=Olea europaea subsp. europaea TaxID=158383 RepID=A0A8S0PW29_OLEEU|nr:Hypothetical predicted protein [Olea europaea subsp. europaea]
MHNWRLGWSIPLHVVNNNLKLTLHHRRRPHPDHEHWCFQHSHMEGPRGDMEDDPDFNDSDNILLTCEDDRLFDSNVMEGIEVRCDERGTEREDDDVVVQNE